MASTSPGSRRSFALTGKTATRGRGLVSTIKNLTIVNPRRIVLEALLYSGHHL